MIWNAPFDVGRLEKCRRGGIPSYGEKGALGKRLWESLFYNNTLFFHICPFGNSHLISCFPLTYNLQEFKCKIKRHLFAWTPLFDCLFYTLKFSHFLSLTVITYILVELSPCLGIGNLTFLWWIFLVSSTLWKTSKL